MCFAIFICRREGFRRVGGCILSIGGLENDPRYEARKRERKLEVYRRHNLNLIELTDKEVSNLDDHLPRLLLEYKIVVD